MDQDRSGNPALSKGSLSRITALESANTATVGGTIFKTLILITIVIVSAIFSWQWAASSAGAYGIIIFTSMFAALGFGLITSFKPNVSPITAPLYAVAEGFLLGAFSMWANQMYGAIVLQAVALTGVIFFSTLFLYQARIVKVTEKFRSVVLIATLGVFIYYLATFLMGFFGVNMPLINDNGPAGIAFSLVIIFIASLNLLLDFNLVETAAANKAPKVFEWYGAFALIVTLVWLYLEALRLIGKVRG